MRLANKIALTVSITANIAFGYGLTFLALFGYDHSVAMSKMTYSMTEQAYSSGCMEGIRAIRKTNKRLDSGFTELCNKNTIRYLQPIKYMRED